MNERQDLIRQLDQLTSRIVRLRDGCCVVCGSLENLSNGHVYSRVRMATRFDISRDGNCHCQCMVCNLRHVIDKGPYYGWYRRRFGKPKLEELLVRSNGLVIMKIPLLEAMLREYKALYKTMLERDTNEEESAFGDLF